MNNQEKFTTRSSKLKVHIANSQTIPSHPVRFSTDNPFSSIVSFAFSCLFALFVIEIKHIYSDTHLTMRAGGDKKIFTRPISENRTTLF